MIRYRNDDSDEDDLSLFIVQVTPRFLVLSLIPCILIAFAVGKTARTLMLEEQVAQVVGPKQTVEDSRDHTGLPTPILKEGKVMPHTTYSSRNFDTSKSAPDSRFVIDDGANHIASVSISADDLLNNIDVVDEAEHLSEGQHLLIDIANVDSSFLASEERLADAMVELIDECDLTLLSYHCHSLTKRGVSCAGILLESHVSFHTWPSEGVISLDLFTCGELDLLPVVSTVETLFAIPCHNNPEKSPHMIWAHKNRGFGDKNLTSEDIAELTDLAWNIGEITEYKKQIVTANTDYQRIDIWDVLDNHHSWEMYMKSLVNDESYESLHREYFAPDRMIFLDSILQSRRSGDAAYHESLVHPAMFAHSNPERVAIIGGGEGATLREVLKHNTVKHVVMVEIDEEMVKLSREFLPEWSDCSNLVGSKSKSCFEDPRVALYFEDAFQWFVDRFQSIDTESKEGLFDVIIVDALDPQIQKDFVDALYDEGPFLHSLCNALSDNGILVGQLGAAPGIDEPPEDISINKNRVKFIQTLVTLNFESIIDYEESRGGFEWPWQFLVAFKSFDTRADWFVSEAEVNLKIRKRLLPTQVGDSPVLSFDGATMLSYMHPSKASEVVFCLRVPKACEPDYRFDPAIVNLPLNETLEVKQSSLGEKAGRGVFSKQDIPVRSYVGLQSIVHSVYMSPSTYTLIGAMGSHKIASLSYGEVVFVYSYAYGHSFSWHGKIEIFADSSLHCFINHGCKGTNNVGHLLEVTEESADPKSIHPEVLNRYFGKDRIYNPFGERQPHFFSSALPVRPIKAGDELFDNYLGMSGNDAKGWKEDVVGLREQCAGVGVGSVKDYETWSETTE